MEDPGKVLLTLPTVHSVSNHTIIIQCFDVLIHKYYSLSIMLYAGSYTGCPIDPDKEIEGVLEPFLSGDKHCSQVRRHQL